MPCHVFVVEPGPSQSGHRSRAASGTRGNLALQPGRDDAAAPHVVGRDTWARDPEGSVLQSEGIKSVLGQVWQVAPTGASVLLQGETGVGKEFFAQAIHDASPRRHRPMIRVNCAALPTTLIGSELFGHEQGAFTGAIGRQV